MLLVDIDSSGYLLIQLPVTQFIAVSVRYPGLSSAFRFVRRIVCHRVRSKALEIMFSKTARL